MALKDAFVLSYTQGLGDAFDGYIDWIFHDTSKNSLRRQWWLTKDPDTGGFHGQLFRADDDEAPFDNWEVYLPAKMVAVLRLAAGV